MIRLGRYDYTTKVEPSASSEQPKLTKLSQSGQFYSKGNDRADLSEQGQFLY